MFTSTTGTRTVSTQLTPSTTAGSTTATTAVAPLSSRAAATIFGSMVLLIVALTVVLVQTTWATQDNSADASAPASQIASTDLAQN